MDETTTKKLNDVLAGIDNDRDMEAFMAEPQVTDGFRTFTAFYLAQSREKDLVDTDMIRKSGIEKSYYYQIVKGSKRPGRDKVLRLCLAAGFSLRETTRALELTENALLYPKRRRDIILTVAINQHASVDEANMLLHKYGEEMLG